MDERKEVIKKFRFRTRGIGASAGAILGGVLAYKGGGAQAIVPATTFGICTAQFLAFHLSIFRPDSMCVEIIAGVLAGTICGLAAGRVGVSVAKAGSIVL